MFDEHKAWALLNDLASRGKRAPGTKEHREAIEYLYFLLQDCCSKAWLQQFSLPLRGEEVQCANICGFIPGKNPSFTILIGSHFDTRWIADNEDDEIKRTLPIPGVNDGTSGVVVILELARIFRDYTPQNNLLFILFDVEAVSYTHLRAHET